MRQFGDILRHYNNNMGKNYSNIHQMTICVKIMTICVNIMTICFNIMSICFNIMTICVNMVSGLHLTSHYNIHCEPCLTGMRSCITITTHRTRSYVLKRPTCPRSDRLTPSEGFHNVDVRIFKILRVVRPFVLR